MDKDKKIVVIGGGHGTSVVLKSLSDSVAELTGVLSMADDGGSTGRLRNDLGVSAVGDIRQCLTTLSARPEIAELFSYRFDSGGLKGHSLGNLILAAEELQENDLEKGINKARKILGVKADIIPSTNDKCGLILELAGEKTAGVYKIANVDFKDSKPNLSLQPVAKLSESARAAINEADFILIAPGNFYCSIIPALLVEGMTEAINATQAKVIFISNLVNRRGHTGGFRATDYIDETRRIAGELKPDALIYNTAKIAEDCLREGEEPVGQPDKKTDYLLIAADISDTEKVAAPGNDEIAAVRSLVRHNGRKLAEVLEQAMENL
ncbi:MAG TPA: gluconeogenesis factor YvcK family protein [Candidatus Saccharimonadales bacterium]|nr:gluconeogenesis factor YvcK family protein [Candidatus Saccharimonadales bacterium]